MSISVRSVARTKSLVGELRPEGAAPVGPGRPRFYPSGMGPVAPVRPEPRPDAPARAAVASDPTGEPVWGDEGTTAETNRPARECCRPAARVRAARANQGGPTQKP